MTENVLEPGAAEELIGACRTTVGDELRSITYFTEEAVEQVTSGRIWIGRPT